MTDVPPNPGPTPPSGTFDDDALADALAAQVANYTSPIQIIPPAPPAAAEPAMPAPVDQVSEEQPAAPAAPSTLDAIQRLEDQLRRLGLADSGAAPEASEPAAPMAAAPEPVAPEAAAPEAAAPEVTPPEATPSEPALQEPALPEPPNPESAALPEPPVAEPAALPEPPVAEPAVLPEEPFAEPAASSEPASYEPTTLPEPPTAEPAIPEYVVPDYVVPDLPDPVIPDYVVPAAVLPEFIEPDDYATAPEEAYPEPADDPERAAPEPLPADVETPAPWEAALDHPAPGHVFPSPFAPFGEATEDPEAEAPDTPPAVQTPPAEPVEPPVFVVPVYEPAPSEPAPSEPPVDSTTIATPPVISAPIDSAPTTPEPEPAEALPTYPQPAFAQQPVPEPAPEPPVPDPAPEPAPPLPDPAPEPEPSLPEPPPAPAPPGDEWVTAPPPSFTPPPLVDPLMNDLASAAAPATRDQVSDLPPPIGLAPAPLPPYIPEATEPASLDDQDDAVDDIDRAFAADAMPVTPARLVDPVAPPSTPIATQRLQPGAPAIVDARPENHPALVVEHAGAEPTSLDLRAGRAARLFWLWFAANSSVLSLAVGAVLFTLGMSLRQTIVATLAGVAISFLPLGLGTLAGKWSGQPTMVISRAAFGHVGNILPVIVAVISRVFWGAVLLWLLATSVARVLVKAGLDAGLGVTVWTFVGLVAGFIIVTVIAVFGYGFVARLQLIVSIVNGILVVGVIALTYPQLDLDTALATGDGSWTLVVTGTVIVFSVVGLAWVHSSSDLARYQRVGSSGAQSMLWSTFGTTLAPFLLICWGAMLSASDPDLARGFAQAPLETLAGMLPLWYPAPLLAAAAVGLLSGAVVTIYSGGFALVSLGLTLRRSVTTVIAAVLAGAIAVGFVVLNADATSIVRDVATTIAVPVAAWAGIYAAEMMIRTRRFHTPSLLKPGGLYPRVRIVNLLVFLALTAVGFGLSSATLAGLAWQGYLFPILGIAADNPLASSDVGVLVALVLAVVLTLVTGFPAIRKQEEERPVTRSNGVPTGAIPYQKPKTGAIPVSSASPPLPAADPVMPAAEPVPLAAPPAALPVEPAPEPVPVAADPYIPPTLPPPPVTDPFEASPFASAPPPDATSGPS